MERRIFGYIRVSCNKQTVENQKFEIENFCRTNHYVIDSWIEETISGTKAYNRRALGRLLARTRQGDVIICSELSRLGRNLYMVMEILNICMNRKCVVWTVKDNFRLGDTIESKVLAFAFGLSAEIERQLISQRTKEALARRRAEGVRLGRPSGSGSSAIYKRLDSQIDDIRRWLEEGKTKKFIISRCRCSKSTLYRYLKERGIYSYLQRSK